MLSWVSQGLGIVALALVVVLLFDLRGEFKRTGATVNQHLPEILAKTRTSTETLATLSEDIRQLRDLAGATGPRDATLAKYADDLLDRIERAEDARIGVEALIGKGLKDPQPARQWTAEARKEALYLTFRVAGREELLDRLTKNKFGSDWLIQQGDAPPVTLRQWLDAQPAP
jgi:hypothetical protein